MKILITGGFGFIGTHLVEHLLENEPTADIHIVDDLSTSIVNHEEFVASLKSQRVTFDIMTVSDFLNKANRYDQVYHLASIVGPAGVLPHAGRIAYPIIKDSMTLAFQVKQWGARLVDVSTSELYGGGTSSESDSKVISSKVSARLEYAVGKLAAEVALINRSKTDDLDVVIVRPFNVAGPRQSKEGGFVLPRFSRMALRGEPLTVFGDGSQLRAFTHVKDMANGLWLAMNHGVSGEAYNIGDPFNRTTIKELAQRVIKSAKSKSEIQLIDPKKVYGQFYEEANDKLPDSTKAIQQLGWRACYDLDDIVTDALKWEKTLL